VSPHGAPPRPGHRPGPARALRPRGRRGPHPAAVAAVLPRVSPL